MANEENLLFENYKDKSNSLQRTIIIFLGIAFFFFFMILIPYYSLKVDTYRLSNIYGLLNNTLEDVRYSASAISDQYFENLGQNRNLTQNIDAYGKQLQNQSVKDNTLKEITYRSCDIHVPRSQAWIICNSDIKIEQLQGQLKATIKLNDTAVSRIQDAIHRQSKLLEESKSFLDITKIGRIKGILENLTSEGSVQNLYGQQPIVINLTQGVNKQISNLLTQINGLSDRYKSLDTPLGGAIPVGFNEMLAVFPLALSIVFCYVAMTLRDTMRLRRVLSAEGIAANIRNYISNSPLWIDPKPSPGSGKILHSIIAWTVLAIPFLLFIVSIIIISFILFWMPIGGDKFPLFVAAAEFNKLSYSTFYVIGGVLFGFSYSLIIKEVRK